LAIGAALFVVAVAVEEINKQLLYIIEHLLNQSCSKYSKNTIFLKSCEESVSSIFCIFLLTLLETAQKIAQD
jgi:membrane protease subunit (stomatin/prohibitin family)